MALRSTLGFLVILTCLICGIFAGGCSVSGVGSGICQDKSKNSCAGGTITFWAGSPKTDGKFDLPPLSPCFVLPWAFLLRLGDVPISGWCQRRPDRRILSSCSKIPFLLRLTSSPLPPLTLKIGRYYPGYCPGPANVQCCVKNGAAYIPPPTYPKILLIPSSSLLLLSPTGGSARVMNSGRQSSPFGPRGGRLHAVPSSSLFTATRFIFSVTGIF